LFLFASGIENSKPLLINHHHTEYYFLHWHHPLTLLSDARTSAVWRHFWCGSSLIRILAAHRVSASSLISPPPFRRANEFFFSNSKHDVIHKLEISLSQHMRGRGFVVQAMHP
jgi:hypothetical protein